MHLGALQPLVRTILDDSTTNRARKASGPSRHGDVVNVASANSTVIRTGSIDKVLRFDSKDSDGRVSCRFTVVLGDAGVVVMGVGDGDCCVPRTEVPSYVSLLDGLGKERIKRSTYLIAVRASFAKRASW